MVTIHIETSSQGLPGWRHREVPADLWRTALLRELARQSRLPGELPPPFVQAGRAGPWSRLTPSEVRERQRARQYLGLSD